MAVAKEVELLVYWCRCRGRLLLLRLLSGVLILGLRRRIPTGVVCHPSVFLVAFSFDLPNAHPHPMPQWATTETVGGGGHPYPPQCGQASSAGDLLGTGGAHVWRRPILHGLWGPCDHDSRDIYPCWLLEGCVGIDKETRQPGVQAGLDSFVGS